jgi:hypothetical protein
MSCATTVELWRPHRAAHLPAVPQDGGRALARTVQAGEPHPRAVRLAVDATIRNLHRLTRGEIWDAGKYKDKDGGIIERYPDGSERVRFRTAVSPNALFSPPSRTNQPPADPSDATVPVAKTH